MTGIVLREQYCEHFNLVPFNLMELMEIDYISRYKICRSTNEVISPFYFLR